MASSYSTDLKLELMVTGENAGTWGDKTNTNLNLVQQAIAGVESIALTDGGTVTLVMSDAAISNARNMVLKLTGTLTTASNLAIPDSIEKFYIIDATSVTGPTNLTVKTVSGTGFTLDQAKIYACYTDGTNVTEVSLDTLGGTVAAANITGTISTAQISDNAITTAKISDNQITTAKISDNQITTAKISDNQVTAAKLDDVLTDSGGTAGAYTTADITVDAQGRITAVASGVAGGTAKLQFTNIASTTSPGSYTTPADAIGINALIEGGAGGGSGGTNAYAAGGAAGGKGGFGFVSAPAATNFSWTAGNPGAGGNPGYNGGNQGSPGGATTFSSPAGTLGTANGGNGAGSNPWNAAPVPGNPGSASGPALNKDITNTFYNIYGTPHSSAGNGGRGNPGGFPGNPGGAGRVTILEYVS